MVVEDSRIDTFTYRQNVIMSPGSNNRTLVKAYWSSSQAQSHTYNDWLTCDCLPAPLLHEDSNMADIVLSMKHDFLSTWENGSTESTISTATTSIFTPDDASASACSQSRLRWSDHTSVFRYLDEECEIDRAEIWYTPGDYQANKDITRFLAKEWRRMGYGFLLKDTFEEPHSQTVQKYLNAFVQQEEALCRRGLERHLSRQHGEERSAVKNRARHTVLSLQRRARRSEIAVYRDFSEEIAAAYAQACVEAKVFARRLAIADHHCTVHGDDNSPANQMLDEYSSFRLDTPRGLGSGIERRMSNASNGSFASGASFDSQRDWCDRPPVQPRQASSRNQTGEKLIAQDERFMHPKHDGRFSEAGGRHAAYAGHKVYSALTSVQIHQANDVYAPIA
jgi:hypothetical protein